MQLWPVWASAVLIALPCGARAQTPPNQASEEPQAEVVLEAYLDRLNLKALLARQLEAKLASVPREQRLEVAERLGAVYVDLLGAAETSDVTKDLEDRSRKLLQQVPEADTFALRINLNKAVYLNAEEVAEKHRLRLAAAADIAAAEASLRTVAQQCRELGSRLNARVTQLERVESAGDSTEVLQQELGDARRLRSLAYYYAGWASTYVAMLSASDAPAIEGMKDFGWLLSAGNNRAPAVERVPIDLLKYEHIARSVVGCAMCASIRGNDVEALRWLDLVADDSDVPASVKAQLFSRRMIIYGTAKRWADLARIVRLARHKPVPEHVATTEPLQTPLARLLAIIALEADRSVAAPQIEALAKTALGDLVARKEASQVLDLVKKYGTAPLGDSGFIVHYVRGLQQYDAARTQHEASQSPPDEPIAEASIVNQYRSAANLLDAALKQSDAEEFGTERARSMVTRGRAQFYAGDLVQAATTFFDAWTLAGPNEQGEESLWLAILALDKASRDDGGASAARRTELAAAYLAAFPESEKASRLVLLQASSGALSDDDALKVLEKVARGAPTYEAARRQVAKILYGKYRAAGTDQREFAATRFLNVADEVLGFDTKTVFGVERDAKAAERAIVRLRQMLDATLGVASPDAAKAAALLKTLRSVATLASLDISSFGAELEYREVQIALANGNTDDAIRAVDQLAARSDRGQTYGNAADRLVYRRLAQDWTTTAIENRTAERAEMLQRVGLRIIDGIGSTPESFASGGALNLYSTVADAAATRFRINGDSAQRDLALRLDAVILRSEPRFSSALRRTGELRESMTDFDGSRAAWTTIAESAEPASSDWFEARYHIMRLLARTNPTASRQLLDQHKSLYPDFGPAPWTERFRQLDSEVPSQTGASDSASLPKSARPLPTPSGGSP